MNRRAFLAALPLLPAAIAALRPKAEPETPVDWLAVPVGTRLYFHGAPPDGWRRIHADHLGPSHPPTRYGVVSPAPPLLAVAESPRNADHVRNRWRIG
jgi:hypothetical protein